MRSAFSNAAVLAVVAVITLVPARPVAQDLMLAAVLARAGNYVVEFERQLAGVVAEETYVQQTRSVPIFGSNGKLVPGPGRRRETKSDLLLVRLDGAEQWIQFRDVFEVDRKPVRDRSDRLVKLFLKPSGSTSAQLKQIVSESARYNIGSVQRNINLPFLPLVILEPGNQPRFAFKRIDGAETGVVVDGVRISLDMPASQRFAVPDAAWVVSFKEIQGGTLIRTNGEQDLPSHGRIWIEPETGRVLMGEVIAENQWLRGKLDVSYQSQQPLLGLLVPVEMHELQLNRADHSTIEGIATYANFRQFQVKVDEKIAPVKEK